MTYWGAAVGASGSNRNILPERKNHSMAEKEVRGTDLLRVGSSRTVTAVVAVQKSIAVIHEYYYCCYYYFYYSCYYCYTTYLYYILLLTAMILLITTVFAPLGIGSTTGGSSYRTWKVWRRRMAGARASTTSVGSRSRRAPRRYGGICIDMGPGKGTSTGT